MSLVERFLSLRRTLPSPGSRRRAASALGAVAACGLVYGLGVPIRAQDAPAPKPFFGNPAAPIFAQRCAACHTERGEAVGNGTAPSLSKLKAMTPEAVHAALSPNGVMQDMAAGLTDSDKRNLAEYLTGRKVAAADAPPAALTNVCAVNPRLPQSLGAAAWNGWSAKVDNARFQTAAGAGLTAAAVPRLKLKWAFGLPGGGVMKGQPTVAAGRIFVGSDTGSVYAIDAKTGCAYWTFKATAGRLAPTVGPISGHPGSNLAVYFVADNGTAFALDAQDGKLLWKTKIEGLMHVSAASALSNGRLYVPLSGTETISGDNPDYECCKSRGGLVSIDTNTGKIVWKVDTIPTPLVKTGVNARGKTQWGPSGASVWNVPTVDAKRQLIYVGTGNAYGRIAGDTSDAILAFAMKDGRLMWKHQQFKDDAFMARCQQVNAAGGNCPAVLGPDWDFGGGSVIIQTRRNGRDVLLAAGKGGVAVALDPDNQGKLLWQRQLWTDTKPGTRGLVVFGGAADGRYVYYPLQRPGGGLVALGIEDGAVRWTADVKADPRGMMSPPTAIPGIVFTGGWDGVLRAVDARGTTIWSYDTHRDFDTVNKVPANGGTLGSSGPAIVDGMVYVASGYIGTSDGFPGNVLLAFSAK
jgi:polyvinyl alcohol dehydrogenase (cytochrome)